MTTVFRAFSFMACLALPGNFVLSAADANPASGKGGEPDPSLLVYYSFDEDCGKQVPDQSDKGHTGIVRGGKWEENGRVGGSYTFSGENMDKVDIDLSDVSDLKEYTIELWVKHEEPIQELEFCRLFEAGERIFFIINFSQEGEGKVMQAIFFNGDSGVPAISPDPLPLNQWNHVAAVWDGNLIKIFVNGEQQGAGSNRSGELQPLGWASFGWLLNGSVDEFKMYNRALSDDEIKKNFDAVK